MIPVLNNVHMDQDIELKFFIVIKLVEISNVFQNEKQIYSIVDILEKVIYSLIFSF